MNIKSISQEDFLEMLVLGFGRRHSIVNLDGIHDKYVADDGNDELRDPVTVTEKKNCLL